MQVYSVKSWPTRFLSYTLAILALCLLVWGIRVAASAGYSQFATNYLFQSGQVEAGDIAVSASPGNPEAHFSRGFLLKFNGRLPESRQEFERAVALRPQDFILWMELGSTLDELGDQEGARRAYEESVRVAPHFTEPRWALGNVLLRMGRLEEAFAELRQAAASDPSKLPAVIDLAWGMSNGDAQAVEQAIQPQTDTARLALAHFFAKKGKAADALALFQRSVNASENERRSLLIELLAGKSFKEAYELWQSSPEANSIGKAGDTNLVTDGSFESPIKFDDPGFGWQLSRSLQAVSVSLDTAKPYHEAHSLRIEFSGNSNPAQSIISQYILVAPNTQYRLHFAARTEELTSGGLPFITVNDASDKETSTLAQLTSLPQGSSDWHEYGLDFTTGKKTSAVLISLLRQNCGGGLCPIFGHLWLDKFSLQKL